MKPATRQVLELLRLRRADGLTSAEARTALATDRLAARVNELRKAGFDIVSIPERAPNGATFCRYYLRERPRPMTGVQERAW